MEQPRIERQFRLVSLLTENTRYTVSDIASMLNLDKRTIYRYIRSFRDSGFDVYKSGTIYSLGKESKYFRRISQLIQFTDEEACIFLRILSSLGIANGMKRELMSKLSAVCKDGGHADMAINPRPVFCINGIIEAISGKRQVVFRNYCSRSQGGIRDILVEPFAFISDYVGVWGFDIEKRDNRLFMVADISYVDELDSHWEYEGYHRKGVCDIFHYSGDISERIRIRLGIMAHSIILDEYPQSEKYMTSIDDSHWLLDTTVCDWRGVGRFVMGLRDDIEIIDTPELEEYIWNYKERFF